MAYVLLICFILLEGTLLFLSFTKCAEKKQWLMARWMIRALELAVFLFIMLFPGVMFDFKYKLCFFVLLARLARVLIAYFISRNKENGYRSKAGAVFGAIGTLVILTGSLVPAFIFADYHGLETTGIYDVKKVEAILIDQSREESFEHDGSKREIPVHFYYPDTDALIQSEFPVVVFSHGAFGYYESNTSTYQELASNGYIVISLDHPYHSFYTKDTTGKLITVNPDFLQEVFYINEDSTSEEEIIDLAHKWLEIRTADINCVLDSMIFAKTNGTLDEAWFTWKNEDQEVISQILVAADLEKIGLMGHSLGGAASVCVGRQRDDIDAVIDLDGTMTGEQISYVNGEYFYIEEPYPVPVFSMDSQSHFMAGEKYGLLYVNNYVLERALDARHEYLPGSEHMNFTDLPLFSPFLAAKLGVGEIDAKQGIMEVNAMVKEYFDHYLKGAVATWK